MPSATRPFHNRIALVFDFDDTLAPDSFDVLLESCGFDPQAFRAERIDPRLDEGWESILARFQALIEASQARDEPITRTHLQEVGESLDCFEGVPEMFDRLRESAHGILPELEVEFYLLTSGFVEVPRANAVAGEFEALWGCEFAFGDDGAIAFPKRIVTHPEKVRYVLQLAKGLGTEGANSPSDVYREVEHSEWHVPLSQIVYLGDGASDMPVFRLMNEHHGIAIGLYKSDAVGDWRGYGDMYPTRRIENLAKVDYAPDSELMRSLELSVESIAKRIALIRMSRGE